MKIEIELPDHLVFLAKGLAGHHKKSFEKWMADALVEDIGCFAEGIEARHLTTDLSKFRRTKNQTQARRKVA